MDDDLDWKQSVGSKYYRMSYLARGNDGNESGKGGRGESGGEKSGSTESGRAGLDDGAHLPGMSSVI